MEPGGDNADAAVSKGGVLIFNSGALVIDGGASSPTRPPLPSTLVPAPTPIPGVVGAAPLLTTVGGAPLPGAVGGGHLPDAVGASSPLSPSQLSMP
jgi:hypothetical protein